MPRRGVSDGPPLPPNRPLMDIVLATLNAKYAHAAFGLRYLLANMGPLRERTGLLEFDISQRTVDILERLLEQNPRVVGLGVYIWNVEPVTRLVAELKRLRPDIIVIVGGPEVSYDTAGLRVVELADHIVSGEADLTFSRLCEAVLAGASPAKQITAELPSPAALCLPYDLYTDEDITHRVLYVEASRGCPYECEFCLSSLDIPVRQFELEPFLAAMQRLLDRGARQFKFVDRTFNLNTRVSRAILAFFLERLRPGLFLHFELIPDRLPEPLKELIRQFPPGALQFEVGIQTWNDNVAALISRRQDNAVAEQNLRWLRQETGVHLHTDLIVGLPGETRESFGAGFDRLLALGPQEIQVGMLKRLRGTPIVRHDVEFGMIYSPDPPYEILQTSTLDFLTLQKLRRFARFWDLVGNSGNFVETLPWIWTLPGNTTADEFGIVPSDDCRDNDPRKSPFEAFWRFGEQLFAWTGRTNGVALPRLVELTFRYLTEVLEHDPAVIARTLFRDYTRGGRSDRPAVLRPYLTPADEALVSRRTTSLPRQSRHATRVENE